MRVTGGHWRGRRLSPVSGAPVRPTTDKVRESIFNILGPAVHGADVADLCCGCGALGIEALSRGASHAVFVDLAPVCLRTVSGNLERCGADPSRWSIRRSDAVRWLAHRLAGGGPPLLVLADPPYDGPVAPALAGMLWEAMPGSLAGAVLEHSSAMPWPVDSLESSFLRPERRSYGRTTLTVLRPRHMRASEDDHG